MAAKDQRPRRIDRFGLAVIVGLALAARGAVLFQLHDHPLLQPVGGLDTSAYVDLGRRVAAGDLALGPDPFSVAPLYAYFLGMVFALSGGSLLVPRILQVLLGTATVGLAYVIARRFGGTVAASVASVALALTGVVTFNEVVLLQSSLDPFLTGLGLYLLVRALDSGSLRDFGFCGLALGVHALNRPNMLAWGLALVAALAWKKGRLAAAAVLMGVVLAVLPVTLRNGAVSGEWILISSHGGLNFFIGNNPEADGTYRIVPGVTPNVSGQAADVRRVASEALGRSVSHAEASSYFYARGTRFIVSQPGQAARLFARKLALILNTRDLALNFSYAYFSGDEVTLLPFLFVGPGLLVPFGVAGLLLRARSPGDFRLWALFVPVYALAVAAFFVSGRYRLPLLVPLAVGAGLLIEGLTADLRARRGRGLAPAAGLVAAVAILAHWDLGADDGRAHDRTTMLVRLVEEGRAGEALQRLPTYEDGHPQPGVLRYRLGLALLARGRAADAVPHFQEALDHDPGQAEVHLSLGEALLAAGRGEEAVPHLAAAGRGSLRADLVALPHARALESLGRRGDALDVLRQISISQDVPAESWAALGALALELEDPGRAETFLGEAARRAPGQSGVHEARGLALVILGRGEEAVRALETAVQLDPGSPSARLNLAVALAQTGQEGPARRQVAEALRLRPGYPEALRLGEALGRDKDRPVP